MRTTSRGRGVTASRSTSRGGRATQRGRYFDEYRRKTEDFANLEAQDSDEEGFQLYTSRRRRKRWSIMTGRKTGTNLR